MAAMNKEAADLGAKANFQMRAAEIGRMGAAAELLGKKFAVVHERVSAIASRFRMIAAAGTASMIGMASIASPVAALQFTYVLRDLSGVIGRELVPYLQTLTRGIRYVADSFASLDPTTRKVVAALAVFGTVGATLVTLLPLVTGGISGVIAAVRILTTAMALFNVSTGGSLLIIGAVATGLAALTAYLFGTKQGANNLKGVFSGISDIMAIVKTKVSDFVAVVKASGVVAEFWRIGEAVKVAFLELGPIFDTLLGYMQRVLPSVTTFSQVFVTALQAIAKAAQFVVVSIGVLISALSDLSLLNPGKFMATVMERMIALEKLKPNLSPNTPSKSSVGAGGGGSASFSNIAEVQRKAQLSALMIPFRKEEEKRQADAAENARKQLEEQQQANDQLEQIAANTAAAAAAAPRVGGAPTAEMRAREQRGPIANAWESRQAVAAQAGRTMFNASMRARTAVSNTIGNARQLTASGIQSAPTTLNIPAGVMREVAQTIANSIVRVINVPWIGE